jgi:hypothetical protein
MNKGTNVTSVGTDIEEVKQKNANSGLSYNEAKRLLAETTGGNGTAKYSNTNADEVRMELGKQGE